MEEIDLILEDTKERMDKSIQFLITEFIDGDLINMFYDNRINNNTYCTLFTIVSNTIFYVEG